MSNHRRVSQYINQIFQTSINIVLFRLNRILTWAADILESDTFDQWRMQYGNWYNLRLLRRFIDRKIKYRKKFISFHVSEMETIGSIVIAKIVFSGCPESEAIQYVEESLSLFMPNILNSLQTSLTDKNILKLTFSV